MLGHDLRAGIWTRRKFLLIPCALALIPLCASIPLNIFNPELCTLGSFLLYMFGGSLSADTLAVGEVLDIPILWILFQTGCLLYTASYPTRDLEQAGLQFILRGGGRVRWWLSKCTWNVLSVCIYYATTLCTMVLFCLVRRVPLTLTVSSEFAIQILPNCDVFLDVPYSEWIMGVHLILIQVLMMVTLNLLQMFVSMFFQPIIGFIISVAILVWSIFQTFPLAIGNYGMMQRNSLFYSDGLDFIFAIPLLCLLCLLIIAAGGIGIKRKDILPICAGG